MAKNRKHGTYRPNLAKLVASNSIEDIQNTTRDAFRIYETNHDDYAKAVTAMSKLKGVGPATASLFLSCYDPVNVPFFSDELYRYLHWEEARAKGWYHKIGYTMKEYKALYDRLQSLRERLEKERGETIRAVDIEKMAYALGKRAQQASSLGKREQDGNVKELQPPSPKKRKKSTAPPSERPVDVCLRKGPQGSPTYDEAGFELDYDFVLKASGRPRPLGKRALKRLDEKLKEGERKKELMEASEGEGSKFPMGAWDDKVARDLGIAYHEVGIEEYEEWYHRGFRRKKGELELENLSNEEIKRLDKLVAGSALRKGSKH